MSDTQAPIVPANKDEAIQALASVPDLHDHQVGAVLLVTGLPEDNFEVAQLRPTQSAAPALRSVGEAALSSYRECEVIEYAPATSCVGQQVMWLPLDQVPLLRSLVDDSSDLADVELFDPKQVNLAKATLSAIRVESETGPVIFIQSVQGSQVVARSTKFGVLVKKGVIDVPKGDLLLLNQGVTAMIAGSFIFFRNREAFQRLFKLLHELRERAETTFREVTSDLSIENVDQMLSAVTTQSQMLGKMASIQSKIDKYPKYKAAMTMPKLLAFIRSHPECQVELSGSGDDAKLVFRSDAQHRFKILKLLDDDYLRSELTTLEYEANSKGSPIG